MEEWKQALAEAVRDERHDIMLRAAKAKPAAVIRYLTNSLYSSEDKVRWNAIRALGALAADRETVSDRRVRELLRRFFWWLNDESGAVPFGVPEAIGEILAVRPEFQLDFLPLLCGLAHEQDVIQTGPIERGVYWALGRIGENAAGCSAEAAATISEAARNHPDQETRNVAQWALRRLGGPAEIESEGYQFIERGAAPD